MGIYRFVRRLWHDLRCRRSQESELDAELQAMVATLADDHERRGKTPAEALRAARLELAVEPVKEEVRAARAVASLASWLQDVRYAGRTLRRSPVFTLTALAVLALGIGVTTAMASLVNGFMLRPLSIPDPDSLIAIVPVNAQGREAGVPLPAIEALDGDPLTALCGYFGATRMAVLAADRPAHVASTFVTGRCFEAFGVRPWLGRLIDDGDAPLHTPGAHVAVISHRFWESHLQADPAVIGQRIIVDQLPMQIIGVLPPGFLGLEADLGLDVFVPYDTVTRAWPQRRPLAYYLVGRLRRGLSLAAARATVEARWRAAVDVAVPATLPGAELRERRSVAPRLEAIGTGVSSLRLRYGGPMVLLLALTLVLLVLACVNLGSLALARQTARRHELGVRIALGGTRWRIARQMLTESVLTSLTGAVLGVPVAFAISAALARLILPANVPLALSLAPDARVIGAALATGVLVGVLIAAAPVWSALRRPPQSSAAWDRTLVGRSHGWLRGLLVLQVMLSLVLLVQAALLTRSLSGLQQAFGDLRTSEVQLAIVEVMPGVPLRQDQAAATAYYPALLERVADAPGVQAVALAARFPRLSVTPRGLPAVLMDENASETEASFDSVSPSFFDTMRIPLRAGRAFRWADRDGAPPVAIVSEGLARALAPGGDVLGRRLRFGTGSPMELEIVGIAGDTTQGDPRVARPRIVYLPLLQWPVVDGSLLIATRDPAAARSAVQAALAAHGRHYLHEFVPLDDYLARAPSVERLGATVAIGIAALAGLLAGIGVYGTFAFAVTRRRRELGLRLALGATRRRLAVGVLWDAARLVGIGIAAGVPLAVLAARGLDRLMFGVSPVDVPTYAGAVGFVAALGVVAVLGPAVRAGRIDPSIMLRSE